MMYESCISVILEQSSILEVRAIWFLYPSQKEQTIRLVGWGKNINDKIEYVWYYM